MPPAVFWCEAPLAPSLRELLSEREAEGVYPVGCYNPMVFAAPCRGRQLGDPLARSALGFPRGEAAERSEADEGWRQVGQ